MEDLSSLYHQDIQFVDPITTHRGLDAVKAYFAGLLESTASCRFDIHSLIEPVENQRSQYSHIAEWTMHLTLRKQTKVISVDGVSLLRVADGKIIYHRDYYDLGEMVYEHIPVLKQILKIIKKKLTS